jgi:hypothetical protein|tara:strand:+ start:673 stop:1047 length:375 start_codon:yes stop_codon:yes gene_type:complete
MTIDHETKLWIAPKHRHDELVAYQVLTVDLFLWHPNEKDDPEAWVEGSVVLAEFPTNEGNGVMKNHPQNAEFAKQLATDFVNSYKTRALLKETDEWCEIPCDCHTDKIDGCLRHEVEKALSVNA